MGVKPNIRKRLPRAQKKGKKEGAQSRHRKFLLLSKKKGKERELRLRGLVFCPDRRIEENVC